MTTPSYEPVLKKLAGHLLKARIWDFAAGLFVGSATNILTSDNLQRKKLTLGIALLWLAFMTFGTAAHLEEIRNRWEGAQAQDFQTFALNSVYTASLKGWWRKFLLSVLLVVTCILWRYF